MTMKTVTMTPGALARGLLRGSAALAVLAAMGYATVAPVDSGLRPAGTLLAQAAQNGFVFPDKLAPEKSALIREINYPVDEPGRLGNRISITELTYANGQVEAEVRVNWKNANGAAIEGVLVEMEVKVRAGEEPGLSAFKDVPQLSARGTTRSGGVVRLKTALKSDSGLMPGEYYVKMNVVLPAQDSKVRAEMMTDPTICSDEACARVAKLEVENVSAERRIEAEKAAAARAEGRVYVQKEIPNARDAAQIRKDFLLAVEAGKNPVSSNQYKLYVGTKRHWIDEGSLADIAKIADMVSAYRKWEDSKKDAEIRLPLEKDPGVKAKLEQQLALSITASKVALDALTFHGYPSGQLDANDLIIRKNAETNRGLIQEEIWAWEDKLVGHYLTIINGDFAYWAWKASVLYGNPVIDAVRDNKLPWGNPDRPLKYGKDAGKTVTDMRSYRDYLKERTTLNIKGDKDTWPENGFTGGSDLERRGGLFSERLLPIMLADIDAFDLMKYITKEKDENGKDIWVLNDVEWSKFEEKYRSEIGADPALADPKLLQAFTAAWSVAPMSTGDRVRSLDVTPSYGMTPTRFPTAFAQAKRSLDTLAALPMSYRYTIYTDVNKLTGRDLENALGSVEAFPMSARRRINTLYTEYSAARKACEEQMNRYEWWYDHNYIHSYSEGVRRNLPASGKKKVKDRKGNVKEIEYNREADLKAKRDKLKNRNKRSGAINPDGGAASEIKEEHIGSESSGEGG